MQTEIKKVKQQASGSASSSKRRGLGRQVKHAGITARGKTLHIKSILVPIDFSELSQNALVYAATIAKMLGAKLTLLHVVEPMTMPDFPYSSPFLMEEGQVLTNAKQRLTWYVKTQGIDAGLVAKNLVTRGRSSREITDCARTLKSDLIIISTHGYSGIKHVLLGSTAEHVVRHAPCAVLVLRHQKGASRRRQKKAGLTLRKILAPLDFSEYSLSALNYAVAYAHRFHAELTLLSAVHPTFYFTSADDEAVMYAELMADIRRDTEERMCKLLKKPQFRGLKVHSVIRTGDPRSEIVDAATRKGADLIILSTHGRTGLKHVLLGSVAEYVVRHAPCAVLVVRETRNLA